MRPGGDAEPDIAGFCRATHPHWLVIAGEPGSGRTVLACGHALWPPAGPPRVRPAAALLTFCLVGAVLVAAWLASRADEEAVCVLSLRRRAAWRPRSR